MSDGIPVYNDDGTEVTGEDYKNLKESMEDCTRKDIRKDLTTFANDLKNHTCENKELESSDLPMILCIGYKCKGCGEEFYVPLKDMKKDPLYDAFKDCLKCAEGRFQLGKLLSFKRMHSNFGLK